MLSDPENPEEKQAIITPDDEEETTKLIINEPLKNPPNYYEEMANMEILSPVSVSDEFEVGFHSLYSILSTIRVMILVILFVLYPLRWDRFFNIKYLKFHWKFFLFCILITAVLSWNIFTYKKYVTCSSAFTITAFFIGFASWAPFLTVFCLFIKPLMFTYIGKASTLKFMDFWFMFAIQIFSNATVFLIYCTRDSPLLSPELFPVIATSIIGGILSVIGWSCRMFACYAIGFNTYSWYDLILEAPNKYFATNSIYKYVSNPIYGFGYLGSHGIAIYYRSVYGLYATVLSQYAIWMFYFIVEEPFIERMYLNNDKVNYKRIWMKVLLYTIFVFVAIVLFHVALTLISS